MLNKFNEEDLINDLTKLIVEDEREFNLEWSPIIYLIEEIKKKFEENC
jgi:hypothetical protein